MQVSGALEHVNVKTLLSKILLQNEPLLKEHIPKIWKQIIGKNIDKKNLEKCITEMSKNEEKIDEKIEDSPTGSGSGSGISGSESGILGAESAGDEIELSALALESILINELVSRGSLEALNEK